MTQFELHRFLYGERITAHVLRFGSDVHISVFGGQRAHIGAVSIVDPEGACRTVQFPGHKDGAISEQWANALAENGYRPAVVEAGIHYDNLSREGIVAVLALTDGMLADVLERLPETR